MKIAPNEQSFVTPARHRQSSAAKARSFARLLEDGGSAQTLSSTRARSFSEAGLLGLHFAVSDTQTVTNGAIKTARARVSPDRGLPEADAIALEAVPPSRVGVTTSVQKSPKGISSQNPLSARAALIGSTRIDAGVVSKQSPLAVDDGGEIAPAQSVALRVRDVLEARGSRFQLDLSQSDDGAIIVVQNADLSSDDILEIEHLAQLVAASFGVSVDRLIVRNNKSKL